MRTTILVIDGDPASQLAVRELFPETEVQIVTADSGTLGLWMLRVRTPDVIVLAFDLPDVSGLEALERIRQMDARVPVILVIGENAAAGTVKAMMRGAYDCLPKPVSARQSRDVFASAARISQCLRTPRHASAVAQFANVVTTKSAAIFSRVVQESLESGGGELD